MDALQRWDRVPRLRWLAGVVLAGLLAATPLAAQEAEEPAADEASPEAAEEEEAPGAPSARILRAFSLSQAGFPQGLALQGPSAEGQVFFPLPRGTTIEEGWLALSLDHSILVSELASLRIDVDGMPRAAERLIGKGRSDLPLELETDALAQEAVSLSVGLSAPHTENRCFDSRAVPDYAVLRPGSALHLAVDAHSVDALRSAWMLLPQRVTISLGRSPLTPEKFGALLEISRRLLASGREVRYAYLPEIPEDAPVGVLASGLAGARSLLFEGQAADTSFGIGQLVVASAEELDALEAAVAAAQERFQRFTGAAEGEIAEPATRLAPDQDEVRPMRLVRFLDYPVIAVDGTDPEAAASLLAGNWTALADAERLDASAVHPDALRPHRPDGTAFSELGFDDGLRMDEERSEWVLDFGLRDLPQGRMPSAVELQLVVAGRSTDTALPLLNLYLNDVLIGSLELGREGRRRQETLSLPAYLIGVENRLRIEVQRRPDGEDCMLPSAPTPAQILGSSRILTDTETAQPRDFLEQISHFGPDPLFLLPETLLEQADAVMPLLTRLSAAILPQDVRPTLRFFDGDRPPAANRPFLLVGAPAAGAPQAPFTLEEGRGLLRDSEGRTLLEASRPRRAAVLQLARLGDHRGLWVLPSDEGRFPKPGAIDLGRSNVAIIDQQGVALALQNDPEAAARSTYPWSESWRDQLDRYRYEALAGFALLLTLAILVGISRRRRRRQ